MGIPIFLRRPESSGREAEMRLTHFLISNSPQYVNCCREWELDVRGNKIPLIENLVSTEDQFDTLNLCDNELSKLDNFPKLQRLKTLLVCNNRVVRPDLSIAENLPNLTSLVLTSNHLAHLAEIDALIGAKLLRNLSLHDNDMSKKTQLSCLCTLPTSSAEGAGFPEDQNSRTRSCSGIILRCCWRETASGDCCSSHHEC